MKRIPPRPIPLRICSVAVRVLAQSRTIKTIGAGAISHPRHLPITHFSLRRAVVSRSRLDVEWWNASGNRQVDFDLPPFAIVPGRIGAVAQNVLIAQLSGDVLSDPRKIVWVVEDISAGARQAADFSEKLWAKSLF